MTTTYTLTTSVRGTTSYYTWTFVDGSRFVVTSKRNGWGASKDSVRFYAEGDAEGRWSNMAELDRAAAHAAEGSK